MARQPFDRTLPLAPSPPFPRAATSRSLSASPRRPSRFPIGTHSQRLPARRYRRRWERRCLTLLDAAQRSDPTELHARRRSVCRAAAEKAAAQQTPPQSGVGIEHDVRRPGGLCAALLLSPLSRAVALAGGLSGAVAPPRITTERFCDPAFADSFSLFSRLPAARQAGRSRRIIEQDQPFRCIIEASMHRSRKSVASCSLSRNGEIVRTMQEF